MSNNISGNDHKLGKLFKAVERDAPELSREELLALINSETRKGASSMRQNNTQNNKKRVAVMSIVTTIILTALFFVLNSGPEVAKVQTAETQVSAERSTQQPQQSSDAPSLEAHPHDDAPAKGAATSGEAALQTALKPAMQSADVIDPKRWQQFIHKPIDLEVFKPIDVNADQFASLGLLQTDGGEVIYYHKSYKLIFPMFDYIRQIVDENDPNLKILGLRPFYAQYVTDSRGNLMMHYEIKAVKGGSSTKFGIYDRDLSELLKNIKYYGNNSMSTQQVFADSANDVLKLNVIIKAGIMKVDTLLEGKISDQRSFKVRSDLISKQVRAKDSAFKMSLGGMDAIARDYAFDFSNTKDPIVQRTKIMFGMIDRSKMSEMEKISAKLKDVTEFSDAVPAVADKLRLEQLSIKLQYDAYIEQSKLEAAELANPVDLIAVNVRPATGPKANPKLDNGLIFWYRDSDTLREVLNTNRSLVKMLNDPKIKLSVMPNPAMLYLYLNYSVDEAMPLRVTLADITGKQVFTEAWKAGAGAGKKEINVQSIPNGIYMLVLDSERGRTVRQVIVSH